VDQLAFETAVYSFAKGGRIFGDNTQDTNHLYILLTLVIENLKNYAKEQPDQLPLGVLLELEYTQDGYGLRLVTPPESLNVKTD
jgi:hypothetical protein